MNGTPPNPGGPATRQPPRSFLPGRKRRSRNPAGGRGVGREEACSSRAGAFQNIKSLNPFRTVDLPRSLMMRLLIFFLPAFALVACVSAPASPSFETAIIEGAIEDGFDCAMRELNERGFTVSSAERASGFL